MSVLDKDRLDVMRRPLLGDSWPSECISKTYDWEDIRDLFDTIDALEEKCEDLNQLSRLESHDDREHSNYLMDEWFKQRGSKSS